MACPCPQFGSVCVHGFSWQRAPLPSFPKPLDPPPAPALQLTLSFLFSPPPSRLSLHPPISLSPPLCPTQPVPALQPVQYSPSSCPQVLLPVSPSQQYNMVPAPLPLASLCLCCVSFATLGAGDTSLAVEWGGCGRSSKPAAACSDWTPALGSFRGLGHGLPSPRVLGGVEAMQGPPSNGRKGA